MNSPSIGDSPFFLLALAIIAVALWVRNLFLLKDAGFVLLGICILMLAIIYELVSRWSDVDLNSLTIMLSLFSIGLAVISERFYRTLRSGRPLVILLVALIALYILLEATHQSPPLGLN